MGETTHFMKGDSRLIPKPDNFYDLVISHYAHLSLEGMEHGRITINQISGDNNAFERIYEDRRPILLKRIEEAMRVLKLGKNLVIWPEPHYFLKDAGGLVIGKRIYAPSRAFGEILS